MYHSRTRRWWSCCRIFLKRTILRFTCFLDLQERLWTVTCCIKFTLWNSKLQVAGLLQKHSMREARFDAMCCTCTCGSTSYQVSVGVDAVRVEQGVDFGACRACKADACFKEKLVWVKKNICTPFSKLNGSMVEDEFVLVQSLFLRGCQSYP